MIIIMRVKVTHNILDKQQTSSGSTTESTHAWDWALQRFPPLPRNKAFCMSQFYLPSIIEPWSLGILKTG